MSIRGSIVVSGIKNLFPIPSLDAVNLVGNALIRAHTLILPETTVRRLLPDELTLLPQTLTPPGMHPLVLFFQRIWIALRPRG